MNQVSGFAQIVCFRNGSSGIGFGQKISNWFKLGRLIQIGKVSKRKWLEFIFGLFDPRGIEWNDLCESRLDIEDRSRRQIRGIEIHRWRRQEPQR